MLKNESRCTVFTGSSDSLLYGHKWRSQSSVRENNVTRQRTLHRFNSGTSDECDACDQCDECDECNEKKSNGEMKEVRTRESESDFMSRQLVSTVNSQCPLEMQSTKKLFLVNLSPATHEKATIDANVCDESTKLMTLDASDDAANTREEKHDGNGEGAGNNLISLPPSYCGDSGGDIVAQDRCTGTAEGLLQVKRHCVSETETDRSNQLDASDAVGCFMSNFVHRIFSG